MDGGLHWQQASVTWAPQFSRDTMVLRVPASIRSHAREILLQTLPPALERLTGQAMGDSLQVDVEASERVEYDDGSIAVEPGQIVVTAERLTEILDAGDLRQRLDSLTIEAIAEGTPGQPATRSGRRSSSKLCSPIRTEAAGTSRTSAQRARLDSNQ